jgi:FtsZ-binding cell division protein ZapB
MKMDSPEQPPKEPTKHTRVRLASPRKQLERTIQKMAKLSETAMKPEKLVDLMTTLAGLQVRLLDMDRDAKDAQHEALIQENERLKSELAARPTDEDIQIQLTLAKLNGSDSGLLQRLKGEVETLKSQSTTLRAENAELAKTNSGLNSENSQLVEQVRSLQVTNAELQLHKLKLESRTWQELLAEAQAKMDEFKAILKTS